MTTTERECPHEHIRTETTQVTQCRYIPSGWEREDEDDSYETVTLEDITLLCSDCGEVLDFSPGD